MDSRELAVMRKQTKHFIDDNPMILVLHRPGATTPDGAGGVIVSPAGDLPPQTVRKVTQSTTIAVERTNVDGSIIRPDYVIIGMPDLDISEWDTFTQDGLEFRVVYVRDDRRYETWAEVYRYG